MDSFIRLSRHFFVVLVLFSGRMDCTDGSGADNLETDSEHSGQNYFFYQQSEYPRDCVEVPHQECRSPSSSGVHVIKPDGYPDPFEVYCDHDEGSGGWTVIQRRVDSSVNFDRSWEEYKNGFGFLSNNYWLGNEKLSFMTNQGAFVLLVDMELSNGSLFYVTYSGFRISDEWDDYRILETGSFNSSGDIVVNTNPTFQTSCPATLPIEAAYGTGSAVATFSPPVCNDTGDIGVITSVCSSADGLTSGSPFPVGTTTVTCTCTDSGFLTVSCSFLVGVSESTCESGWLTYGGSHYCVHQDTLLWSEANSVCFSKGGHLAWVESEAENQFIADNIAGWKWIGISDVTAEGTWKYVGTEVSSTYFKWGSSEPNSWGGNEDCVAMHANFSWNDYPCTEAIAFICEND